MGNLVAIGRHLKQIRIFSNNLTSSRELQKSLILYSSLGIFIIGILVAVVSIMPLYRQLKKAQERELRFALRTRSMAVEEFLSRAKNVAEQITSRTRARQMLEDYNRGEQSREEMVQFTTRALTEAMNRSEEVVGISRFALSGEQVVQVGVSIPSQFRSPSSIPESERTVVSEPLERDGEYYSIVATPILNPAQERVGTDILMFRVSSLQQIVQDYTGLRNSGEIVLGAVRGDGVQLFFPLRNSVTHRITEASDALLEAIETAVTLKPGKTRILSPQTPSTEEAIAVESLSGPNWGIAIKMDREELYAPVYRQLAFVGVTIVVLSSLGTGGMVLLLRPLTARVIITTDELEQQVRDKTQAIQELKQAQAQLVQTEKMSSLGQMVAGVAHEINNPVTFVSSNLAYAYEYTNIILELLELYEQHTSEPVAEIEEYIEESDLEFVKQDLSKLLSSMKAGADRIYQIVLSLRNFSRLDEAAKKPVDLHLGIESTLLILQYRLKARPHRRAIQIVREYGKLPEIECYANQLNQVFMNLIGNAIDALEIDRSKKGDRSNPPNDKTEGMQSNSSTSSALPQKPTIWIRTETIDGNLAIVRIQDNGCGMPEEIHSKIFDPFFTTKPVGKGTGLGLSISYHIVVEKHGGNIHFKSSPTLGTEFTLEIPMQPIGSHPLTQ